MKIHITPPSEAQPHSPSSKEYSTQHLLEISQAPGPILLKKSCMQKIKKQQQWKESLSECHYIWLVLILRLEVWMILAWCCSALFTAVAAFSQFSRHCRRAKRSPGENQGLFKSSLSPGHLCISLAWKGCWPPATHPYVPHGLLLVPKACRTHSCWEFVKWADTQYWLSDLLLWKSWALCTTEN